MNIVLIITDCLRKDAFEGMSIKKNASLYFDKVISPASTTFFAMPSIMTGTYPFQVVDDARIKKSYKTYLPNIAMDNGYNVVYITANVVTSKYYGYKTNNFLFYEDFLKDKQNFYRHFQSKSHISLLGKIKKTIKNILKRYPKARHFVVNIYKNIMFTFHKHNMPFSFDTKVRIDDVISAFNNFYQSIGNIRNNMFVFIHLMDTHAPYGSPQYLKKLGARRRKTLAKIITKAYYDIHISESEKEILNEAYYSEVEYLDKKLEILLNQIFDFLGYDNTLVLMVSDHGELLGENDFYLHSASLLKDVLLKVPLSIYGSASILNMPSKDLYSSIVVHEIITEILLGAHTVEITPLNSTWSFAYSGKQSSKINYKKYDLIGYACSVKGKNDSLYTMIHYEKNKIDSLQVLNKLSRLSLINQSGIAIDDLLRILKQSYLKAVVKKRKTGIYRLFIQSVEKAKGL